MPLSRNLYEMDEVVSALQTCLRNSWSRGLFWFWELVVSGEETLATNTMNDCWLRWGGGHDPLLLSLPAGAERWVRTNAAIRAAGSLTAEHYLATTAPVRPSVTPRPKTKAVADRRRIKAAAFVASLNDETPTPEESANFWISFDSACRQGSRSDALWLLQAAPLSTDALWSALKIAARGGAGEAIDLLHRQAGPTDQLLFQVAATLHLCIPTAERKSECKIGHETKQWTNWTAMVGRRAVREHAIPADALHQGTTRGSISSKYTNIGDIREPVPMLAEGCSFWRQALAVAGIEMEAETGAMIFPNDDTLESFMDLHFPDDIPDEWSKRDQEMSHGRGCQESAPPAPTLLQICEEPVDVRAWRIAIHVRD